MTYLYFAEKFTAYKDKKNFFDSNDWLIIFLQ